MSEQINQPVLANPAPLGLMAFGMTTVLLNLHNAGIYPLDTMILAMGIFYGGIAQVIASIMEFRKGNTFGTTAFGSFGLFWLTLVFLLVLPKKGWGEAPIPAAMAFYFFIWGFFTFLLFIATLKLHRGAQVIFLSLAILFWLLVLAEVTAFPKVIVGIGGILCGLSAIYVAIAEVTNEVYGRIILPLGQVKK